MRNIVLVTGGTGMVGNAIKKFIEKRKESSLFSNRYFDDFDFKFIGSKDVDLTDWHETNDFFANNRGICAVIHLAANVGGLYKNMEKKLAMFEDNLLINLHVVKACRLFGIRYGVACLSTCIYPNKIESYPIQEGTLHNGPPHYSNEGYAYAKRMLEVQCRLSKKGVWNCVTPTNLFGAFDNFDLKTSHVVPALIRKGIDVYKGDKDEFMVLGSGKPMRQFLYVDDFAEIILWILKQKIEDENLKLPFSLNIISSEEQISIGKLAKIIGNRLGVEDKIVFDETFSDGQFSKEASNNLLLSNLPDNYEFTSICDGINQTIEWYLSNF